jgi:hypothetical protein
MVGEECPIICATNRSDTPAALKRLAKECLQQYRENSGSPASSSALAQLFRISRVYCAGLRELGKTNGEKSGPSNPRQRKSSFLHLAESGIFLTLARVFDSRTRIRSLTKSTASHLSGKASRETASQFRGSGQQGRECREPPHSISFFLLKSDDVRGTGAPLF